MEQWNKKLKEALDDIKQMLDVLIDSKKTFGPFYTKEDEKKLLKVILDCMRMADNLICNKNLSDLIMNLLTTTNYADYISFGTLATRLYNALKHYYEDDFLGSIYTIERCDSFLRLLEDIRDKINNECFGGTYFRLNDEKPEEISTKKTNFRYKEDKILEEVKEYIEKTYSQHYTLQGNRKQALDIFYDLDVTYPKIYAYTNALKYIFRYGKKAGKNKNDLLKAIHCLILFYYYENYMENNDNGTTKS